MIDFSEWVWAFDNASMKYLNEKNGVIVKIKKNVKKHTGKPLDLPVEMFSKTAEHKNREAVQQIVRSAEIEFFRKFNKNIA